MVRRSLAALAGQLVCCLLILCACRGDLNFPPKLLTGAVSDTAQVIKVLPDSNSVVAVSKNGYRVFDLDAMVQDDDDADPTIRWSLSPGPSLYARLVGDMAEVGPIPNQVCTSYVVFTATDPGGLSASRICSVAVFDSFKVLLNTVMVEVNSVTDSPVGYVYKGQLRDGLVWDKPVCDTAWLKACSLKVSSGSKVLTVEAKGDTGTSGIYFKVTDPVNHVSFSHSALVRITQ